jgi:hypothetical protein
MDVLFETKVAKFGTEIAADKPAYELSASSSGLEQWHKQPKCKKAEKKAWKLWQQKKFP